MHGLDREALALSVNTALAQITDAATSVHKAHSAAYASEPPQLRMVSALADGADTIVAKAAHAAGWRVDACLPFPREQ